MRKTKNKWSTDCCNSCYKSHENYSGKLDSDNLEYVVCGITNKKIRVENNSWKKNG